MWPRIADRLSCPICGGHLDLSTFAETRIELSEDHRALAVDCGFLDSDFDRYVEAGLLLCSGCKIYFPILYGLPVLVPYTTPIHHEFALEFNDRLALYAEYQFAHSIPVCGEQFVMNSFSTEWLAYDYDGVIWDLSYDDHEKRFFSELGPEALEAGKRGTFLEIGCGNRTLNLLRIERHGVRCDRRRSKSGRPCRVKTLPGEPVPPFRSGIGVQSSVEEADRGCHLHAWRAASHLLD